MNIQFVQASNGCVRQEGIGADLPPFKEEKSESPEEDPTRTPNPLEGMDIDVLYWDWRKRPVVLEMDLFIDPFVFMHPSVEGVKVRIIDEGKDEYLKSQNREALRVPVEDTFQGTQREIGEGRQEDDVHENQWHSAIQHLNCIRTFLNFDGVGGPE